MKIYVASSWKNEEYESVCDRLLGVGHHIMDWRDPRHAFSWSQVNNNWRRWNIDQYRSGLLAERSQDGFRNDMAKLQLAEIVVLLLPCGRSAHLEAGYAVGAGKPLIVCGMPPEPELMYLMANRICGNIEEVLEQISHMEAAA